ncbi:MAG: ABC transporter ATP-binding protein [Ilumatobacteraceae bacterium]
MTDRSPLTGPALTVDNVSKTFKVHNERANSLKQYIAMRGRNRYEEFHALRDVSFEVGSGEAFGVIGHNGSGKSTLLKCMAGILRPNAGTITVHRRMSALLELGAGFHPDLTGRDNVFLNASILGMARPEIAKRFDEIVEFSGLEQFIDTPVKAYSSGMYVRLAFAVAINVDPEMLLIDEILAVGDVTFQQKCMEKFVEFRQEGRTLVLVTHDLASIRNFCDRAVWLDHGQIAGEGDPATLVDEYTEKMLGTDGDAEHVDGARRGSGQIRVERVEILADGQPTTQPRNGHAATIRLHFRAIEPVPNPVVAIKIGSLGGAIVTAPCSRDTRTVPASLDGDGTIDIEIPDLSLLPGPYVIHSEITGFNRHHIYDHLQNAARFDVVSGDSSENEGLVTLRPTWTISGDGVSAHSEKFPDG